MANNKKPKTTQTDKTIELISNNVSVQEATEEIITEETEVIIIIDENIDSNEQSNENIILPSTIEDKPLEEPEIHVLDYINLNYAQQKQLRRTGRLK